MTKMKRGLFGLISILLVVLLPQLSAQEEIQSTNDDQGMTGSAVVGAVTINGKNYQQMGFRADIPLGKFGFGLDLQLLIDDNGDVRSEDWDDFQDYLDKIYYVRYGYKNDPFYVRVGGLDNSTFGYGIALDGYSNMIEYPSYKRLGGEISFKTPLGVGGEIFINNFKELLEDEPGMVFGARGSYNIGKFSIGAGVVTDFNELNGLRDTDDDNMPDEIDIDPDDDKIATSVEFWKEKGASDETITAMVNDNLIDGRKKSEILADLDLDKTESIAIYTFDAGYNLYQGDETTVDIYGQTAIINDYGWGFAAPAFRVVTGPFNFKAEYRHSEDEFMFGYFNNTYELERAWFENLSATNGSDSLVVRTKKSRLENIKAMDGFFAGVGANLFGVANLRLDYQYMTNDDQDLKSLYGEFGLTDDLIPKLAIAKAYYIQNNVEDFSKWKTPSTILGYKFGYEISEGAVISFDYRYTFEVVPGSDDLEEIKTVQIGTVIKF